MAIVKTITQSNRISLPAAGEDVPRARRPGEQDKSDQYSSPKRQPAKGELFGVCGELLFLKLPFLVAHRVFAKKRIAESKNQLNVGIGGDIPIFPPFALMLGATLGVSLRLALGQWTFLPSSVATISYRIGGFVVGLEAMLMRCEDALEEHNTKAFFTEVRGLATNGPYSVSRNPMYLGFFCMIPACTVLSDSVWMLLSMMLVPLYIHNVVIPKEEKFLVGLFADKYTEYCTRVPRWL
ncbi:hypothetical protein EMIHUDRAFT_238285 [Emiliania huxleyi CCMP1516]|uniref:Protein-S-isoprenylcysteine O-methyltransferase n=2 Tax=Emiliania huxleyi TaxID=2903 RepID=A0A0D3JMQ5_EMIH1|nr:hypothetical protein EMIHUDRAFT_238285 [Emiliania huxleyi CCMP1516]EOD24790.1 hypothetical protein EMIHUDRAFT_238285 [Emiliania huxleyi CCMP1516]|eukprot:XP_005777219.1 hypothetical protein EMIHUDRAFT_238285 [Emiliania huxleyi CCMP1516]